MKLSLILEKWMYKDLADIWRSVLTQEGKSDDYTVENEKVYEGIACHLAQYGVKSTAHRDDTAMNEVENYRVSISPGLEVKANDFVEVNHMGDIYSLFVIKVFAYESHVELDCKRRKQAGQE